MAPPWVGSPGRGFLPTSHPLSLRTFFPPRQLPLKICVRVPVSHRNREMWNVLIFLANSCHLYGDVGIRASMVYATQMDPTLQNMDPTWHGPYVTKLNNFNVYAEKLLFIVLIPWLQRSELFSKTVCNSFSQQKWFLPRMVVFVDRKNGGLSSIPGVIQGNHSISLKIMSVVVTIFYNFVT